MGNALEQLRKETRDDARLYGCIRELYEQGVPFEELKAVIPDIRRTREQLHMKRMLENNNEVLMQMFSREMSFLLDAKEPAGPACTAARAAPPPPEEYASGRTRFSRRFPRPRCVRRTASGRQAASEGAQARSEARESSTAAESPD